MYDIADTVLAWQAQGRDVTVAVLVETRGISSVEPGAALAWTDGSTAGPLAGLAAPVVAAAAEGARDDGLIDVPIDAMQAAGAGLACGGVLTLLVRPAEEFPMQLWHGLVERHPLCLVARGDEIEVFTPDTIRAATSFGDDVGRLFGRGTTAATRIDGGVAVAYWPVPSLVVVGDGLIAAALQAQAALLGWSAAVVGDVAGSTTALAAMNRSDAVIVLSHDRAVDGPVLRAALAAPVGYVGALGSRRTQAARREWLTADGVDAAAQQRIHGPAGLDLDAHTPAEIAVSIVAEILAERAGASATSLRERSGPVHTAGVQAPPPRY